MSGVYIPMEMPKDKAIAVVIHPDGTAYSAEMFAGVCTKYLTDCEAIPVPDHGRLIDADSMEKEVCGGCVHGEHKYANCIDCALANAPTIIPADKEGE